MDGLSQSLISLMLYLGFLVACVAFGGTALVGGAVLLIGPRLLTRLEPSRGVVIAFTLLVAVGAIVLTALILSLERLIPGVYFLAAPPVGLMLGSVALAYCVQAARRNRPWKAAAFGVTVGCVEGTYWG